MKILIIFQIIFLTTKLSDPGPMENFVVEDYLGNWYEQARTFNFYEKSGYKNITANYKLLNPNQILVTNTSINRNRPSKGTGIATFIGDRNIADFEINFGKNKFTQLFQKGRYKIVATDYENYSFIFVREAFFFKKRVFAWILTREKYLDPGKFLDLLEEFLEITNLKKSDLIFTMRDD